MDMIEKNPSRRPRYFSFVLISLISAIIGGLISLSFAPAILGDRLPQGNEDVPRAQAENNPPATSGNSPVIQIAENVTPAVVGISNRGYVKSFLGQSRLVEQSSGSGVIFDKSGYIITNYHVIDNASELVVSLHDGRHFKAQIKGTDPRMDLAVLKINAGDLTVAKLGNSDKLRVGELAVAIGNPIGREFARTVTAGVISALNRTITIEDRQFELLQTDAAINPGNSGGALVNAGGEVIGINSAKLAIQGVEGMGFAIPINDVKPIIREILDKGFISRPWLGLWGLPVTRDEAAAARVPVGIYVEKVVARGPADRAGIKAEDILTEVDGQRVQDFQDLAAVLDKKKPKEQVKVKVYRSGKQLSLPLTLGQMPRG